MDFKTLEVAGFVPAMHAMRNPKDSWSKNDSEVIWHAEGKGTWLLGENDKKLAQSLITGGPVHSKFLRSIMVWVDITAPLYWWAEFDTYKVGVVRNSCSTMHKLLSKIKTISEGGSFTDWDVSKPVPEVVYELFEVSKGSVESMAVAQIVKAMLIVYGDPTLDDNTKLRKLKKMLPDSYLQRSTVCLSYQNIRSMLTWRSDHRLPEWNTDFVKWTKSLPLSKEFLFYNLGGGKA